MIINDVPLFDEHEVEEPVIGKDGKPTGERRKVAYSREVLQSMCDNMNERIADTGDYTAICVAHTMTPQEKLAGIVHQPEVIGFAGPYYVGRFGRKKPRWCIFAKDWAIFKEDVELLRKYPRRSVEVWRTPDVEDRFFDPIAVLGGETPKRDLGLSYYSMSPKPGVSIARYSMAYASGANTFVPEGNGRPRKGTAKYAEGESQPQEGTSMALTEDEVNQILEAFLSTAPMQWVSQRMTEESAKSEAPPEDPGMGEEPEPGPPVMDDMAPPPDGAPEPPAEAPVGPPEGPPGDGMPRDPEKELNADEEEIDGQGGKESDNEDSPTRPTEPVMDSDDKEQNIAPLVAAGAGYVAGSMMSKNSRNGNKSSYSKNGSNDPLVRQNAELMSRIERMEMETMVKDRHSRVSDWATTFLHIDTDAERELASRMTASEWDAHVTGVERYAQRNPVHMHGIPTSAELPGPSRDNAAFHSRVRDRIRRYAAGGIKADFQAIQSEVAKEMGRV